VAVFPGPNAAHLVAARMRWPLHGIDSVSVHGRPLAKFAAWMQPNARLVVLCHDGDTPAAIARMLTEAGYGASTLTVFNRMGGPDESRLDGSADDWTHDRADDLCTLAVICRAKAGAPAPFAGPGLPDDAFAHDGVITKREVRAAALAKLGGGPTSVMWDVGAGCGSLAVEWQRGGPWRQAYAIEPRADRRALIETNRIRLGAPELRIVQADAPLAFLELPAPDAVFVGGGLATPTLLEAARTALKPGGRLVAHAATPDGEAALGAAFAEFGGELARIAVTRVEPVAGRPVWRGRAPITQWAWGRPA
ncbi:MAG: precorrin-6Y C5,15-methyltransferase (decarboxylating) subunit CbiT, partial [Pseudomonadota bacterium]